MQTLQAMTAARFRHTIYSESTRAHGNADEQWMPNSPTCLQQMGTADIEDAIRNYRCSRITAFTAHRIAPALARMGTNFSAFLVCRRSVARKFGWGNL
jgi:hypothetical protein